ncbi:MAG: choice-of-anchor J domain-containing protein [Tenuifilaceae bacterium]|jgi:hypothetical protein|nr:choice-of-anchor J domain-containing protein [Tenuifilaceae bacterium]
MKKILLFAISIFALAFVFNACEETEDPFYTGVSIHVDKLHYYPLDANYQANVEVSSFDVTTLTIYKASNEIGTTSISNGKGQVSIPKASLNELEKIGDKVTLNFQVDGPDGLASRNRVITLNDPVVITALRNIEPKDTTIKVEFKVKEDCTAPTSVTVTRALNSDDPVAVTPEGSMTDGWVDVLINPDMNKDTLTFAFTSSNANGTVVSTHTLVIAEQRLWDFEEYDSFVTEFAPWTLVDNDKLPTYTFSSLSYPGTGSAGSWIIFDFEATDPEEVAGWEAHSGTKYAMCANAVPDGDQGNDDWMISKPFAIAAGYSVSLYAKSITDTYGLERLVVKVLEPDTKTETLLTPDPYQEVPTDWTNYTFDLSAFEGKTVQIMIGCVSYDAFALFVDDFEILDGEGKSYYSNNFQSNSSAPVDVKKIK